MRGWIVMMVVLQCAWGPGGAVCGAIHEAAKTGDLRTLALMLDKHPEQIHELNEQGKTPLHLASGWGQIEAMKLLLSRGANIEVRNKDGGTPLHVAASQGKPDSAKLLLARGAKVDAVRSVGGMTPLHIAAMKGSVDVARILIAAGASVNARTYAGATPLQIAIFRGQRAMVQLLRQR